MKMTAQFTCPHCQSSVHVYPQHDANTARCTICEHEFPVQFTKEHEEGHLKSCPQCSYKDFYKQRDFNRKLGVIFFLVASVLSIWTYGISFIVLYLVDYFLFNKLQAIAICYHCSAVFRNVKNLPEIPQFDHEKNDRIVYS